MGLVDGLALVLSGRGREAGPGLERTLQAASVLGARPTEMAARALRAEISGDASDLPDPSTVVASVAEAVVLRAHVVLGNEAARRPLGAAARMLIAPGLLFGI
jgi:hypothetical protein